MPRRIVLAQLEGSGRGALASMNPRSYEDLVGLIQEHPMTDGDAWLKLLIVKNEMLGVGIVFAAAHHCCVHAAPCDSRDSTLYALSCCLHHSGADHGSTCHI